MTLAILTDIDGDQIAQLRSRDEYFWLDLVSPSEADLDRVGALFDLHPLVVEDAKKFDQRPKLDDYGDYVAIVYYGMSNDAVPHPVELHAIVHGSWLLTVRQDSTGVLGDLQKRLQARDTHSSEELILYRILDELTDTFFTVLERYDDAIDQIEDDILSQSDRPLEKIYSAKRELVSMRKITAPQRDLLTRTIDRVLEIPGFETETYDYFRDVHDHMLRISDMIDTYRDLLSGAVDLHLSMVGNRQNEAMKRLNVIATVFLPLTFATGFFGQNFRWMVDHVDTFHAFMFWGVGGLVASCIALAIYFRIHGDI
jgi:magnesium transporter